MLWETFWDLKGGFANEKGAIQLPVESIPM